MQIKIQKDEYWYGGCTSWGIQMPFDAAADISFTFEPNPTPNQGMPLLLSNKGRYLWLEGCKEISVKNGIITCGGTGMTGDGGDNLRSAYLAAMKAYFPFTGSMPAEELFNAPVFNTWIELTFNQNQSDILKYARNIIENGFEPGVLMIDDGWAQSYGCWKFHNGRFPDPAAMLEELHNMGFRIMLWICPYVTADTETYRQLKERNLLLATQAGETFIVNWWNGFSAGLDLSNPAANQWLQAQLGELIALGVDGFKFDGGDATHYEGDCHNAGGVSPNELCRLWSVFGEPYSFNEYRASWRAGGRPMMQRLCDKEHHWGNTGLAALIPDTLAQGITGHPFSCADMVGGGEYLNFRENSDRLEGELFVKHSAVSCLMPAIQFSAAPWRVLSKEQNETIHRQLELRRKYKGELDKALAEAAGSGEPVVRYMEYEFPGQGMEAVRDQFMLGAGLLVAPVLEKGADGRRVFVPKGNWSCQGNRIESRGETQWFACPDSFIVVLERQNS